MVSHASLNTSYLLAHLSTQMSRVVKSKNMLNLKVLVDMLNGPLVSPEKANATVKSARTFNK